MTKRLQEIHPGEILLEEFMKPMAITARRLSADIDVSASRISEIVNGQRPITADTALRLGIYFSMEPRFWLNLQAEYDMRVVTRELKKKIQARIRVFQAVVALVLLHLVLKQTPLATEALALLVVVEVAHSIPQALAMVELVVMV